jgi:hypothetical protein
MKDPDERQSMRSGTDDRSHSNNDTAGVPTPTPDGPVAAGRRLGLRYDRHAGSRAVNHRPSSRAPTCSRAAGEAQAFSYENMPQALADELRSRAERIRRELACHTMKVIEIGDELRHAKARLPHGAFLAWAADEIGISARAAQLYMTASAWIMDRDERFSRLPISTIYLLAARSTPREVADEFARKVTMDAPVTYASIRQRIEAVRRGGREAVAAARAAEGDLRLLGKRVPAAEESSVDSPVMEAVRLVARSMCSEDLDRLQRLLLQSDAHGRLGCLGRQLLDKLIGTPNPSPQ